jgi:hypothetical protein
MKAYGGVDVQIHAFLTLALVGGEWSASRPCTHFTAGWVGPTTFLDDVKKRKFLPLTRLELRPLDRPTRSQSPHQLRYQANIRQPLLSKGSANKHVPAADK